MNILKAVLSIQREQGLQQKRGRTACLAGFDMAGKALIAKENEAEVASFSDGHRQAQQLWPLFYPTVTRPAKNSEAATPQVLAFEDEAVLVVGFFSRQTESSNKSRLGWRSTAVERVSQVIVAKPVESNGGAYKFGPTSQLCHMKVNKKTMLLELEAKVDMNETDGASAQLSPAAYAKLSALVAEGADKAVTALETKIKKQSQESLKEKKLLSEPLTFIKGFLLIEAAFLDNPLTTKGAAQVRTGLHYVQRKRVLAFGIVEEEKQDLPVELFMVAPSYFGRRFVCKDNKFKPLLAAMPYVM